MNREERLRNLILDRYVSLRQFAQKAGSPYSSLMTLLTRGIGGASFDTIMSICRALEVSPFEV